MRCILLLAVALLGTAVPPAPLGAAFVGTWQGTSTCLVKDSPCHDETVVYDVKASQPEGHITISAYKIVNSEKQWMGDLPCATSDSATATCNYPAEAVWTFHLHGDAISGDLRYRGVPFRTIQLKRKP